MDIKPTIAPAPAPGKPQAAEKSASSKDAQGGPVGAPAFSQLLQGLHTQAPGSQGALEEQGTQQLAAEAPVNLADLPLLDVRLDIGSLVGQTQRLDGAHTDADAAVQDGSFVWDAQYAGLAANLFQSQGLGAQPHIAAGQHVATVAAGVQSAKNALGMAQLPAALGAPDGFLAQASETTEAVAQRLSDSWPNDQASEGRVALQGAWKLEDPQSPLHPALQRLMGQVEQWAAASAGVQPKASERLEGHKSPVGSAEWSSAGQGSGTRLTENAVKETQQAQDAAFEPQNDAPVQDMRFWLQGKQQRAEVVLEKDGQPVRVQVSVRGNEAHVMFRADQAATRELLDASLAQLREMLEQQGMQLTGASVQADAGGGQSSAGDGPRSPWDAAPTQHGQVVVPVGDAPLVQPYRAQGVDFYA